MEKNLNAIISNLKEMMGDKKNELGSAQKGALAGSIRKFKKLSKQPRIKRAELERTIREVAETVFKILG